MHAAALIIFLVTFAAKPPGFQEMEACSLLKIWFINSVDKPNFRVSLPHRRSTTVYLETNPLCSLLVNLRKGMQNSSEQPLVGQERYVTTPIMAAKETILTEINYYSCQAEGHARFF